MFRNESKGPRGSPIKKRRRQNSAASFPVSILSMFGARWIRAKNSSVENVAEIIVSQNQQSDTMANETVNSTLNDIQREYQDFLDDDNDEGNYRVNSPPFKPFNYLNGPTLIEWIGLLEASSYLNIVISINRWNIHLICIE